MTKPTMKTTYKLSPNNFYESEFPKTQIVVGNSFGNELDHYTGWKTRHGGVYKKTAPFTILRNGEIHMHYNPKNYSDFLYIEEMDKTSIPIVLENNGWLSKDLVDGGYLTWCGNIYKNEDLIVETRWRKHTFWESYTDEQIESLVDLCEYLCKRFSIPKIAMSHNTFVDGIDKFEGVTFRSNYDKYSTDVNPTFKFDEFKHKLEQK